jgi:hypothetical protein
MTNNDIPVFGWDILHAAPTIPLMKVGFDVPE